MIEVMGRARWCRSATRYGSLRALPARRRPARFLPTRSSSGLPGGVSARNGACALWVAGTRTRILELFVSARPLCQLSYHPLRPAAGPPTSALVPGATPVLGAVFGGQSTGPAAGYRTRRHGSYCLVPRPGFEPGTTPHRSGAGSTSWPTEVASWPHGANLPNQGFFRWTSCQSRGLRVVRSRPTVRGGASLPLPTSCAPCTPPGT